MTTNQPELTEEEKLLLFGDGSATGLMGILQTEGTQRGVVDGITLQYVARHCGVPAVDIKSCYPELH